MNGGINLYAYSKLNPINAIDPFGLTDITINVFRTHQNDTRTLGTVSVRNSTTNQQLNLYSLELPDNNNQPFTSRINAGSYNTQRWTSPTHGEVLRLDDANGHTDILWHPGNVAGETEGCLLPGTEQTENSVLNSVAAMNRLINYVDGIVGFDRANNQPTNITKLQKNLIEAIGRTSFKEEKPKVLKREILHELGRIEIRAIK